jgi:hypothetical protein
MITNRRNFIIGTGVIVIASFVGVDTDPYISGIRFLGTPYAGRFQARGAPSKWKHIYDKVVYWDDNDHYLFGHFRWLAEKNNGKGRLSDFQKIIDEQTNPPLNYKKWEIIW